MTGRHRGEAASWLMSFGVFLLVLALFGASFWVSNLFLADTASSASPAPAVTVTRTVPFPGPTPTITQSFLIYVTPAP